VSLSLGELITALEAADPNLVIPRGFTNPHSYRGYYDQVAFEPARNVTVASMLAAARSALGATFQGWKGGDYVMGEHTECWIAVRGNSDGELIGLSLLGYMLASGRPVSATEDTAMTDPQDRPEWDGYELVIPFVACTSQGGAYEDVPFVAGYQAGQIARSLAAAVAIEADTLTFTAYTDLTRQLDLIGMHHGFTVTAEPCDGVPEWSYVTFTRAKS
jgi:hypothetical protein